MFVYYNYNTAFAVEIDGMEIGIVKNKEEFNLIIDELTDELENRTGSDIQILDKIEFRKLKGFNHKLTSEDEIRKELNLNKI